MRHLNGDGHHNNKKVLLRDTSRDRSQFRPSSSSSCGWLHKRRRDYRQRRRVILLWHTVVMVVRHRGIPHTNTTRRRCGGKHTIHDRISRPIILWRGNIRIRTLNFQSRQDTVKMLDKFGRIVRRHMNVPQKSSIVIAMIKFLSLFYGGGSSSSTPQHTGDAGQTSPQPMDS